MLNSDIELPLLVFLAEWRSYCSPRHSGDSKVVSFRDWVLAIALASVTDSYRCPDVDITSVIEASH